MKTHTNQTKIKHKERLLKAARWTQQVTYRGSEVKVAQLCPTLCNPLDCSLPGSSVYGIFQARILQWVAIPFSRGSSQPRDWTQVFIAGRVFTIWSTREAPTWVSHCEWDTLEMSCGRDYQVWERLIFIYISIILVNISSTQLSKPSPMQIYLLIPGWSTLEVQALCDLSLA